MLSQAFSAFSNHLLDPAPWAAQKLAAHAGKCARFQFLNLHIEVQVRDNGALEAVSGEVSPAVCFRLTPATLMEILADRKAAWKNVVVEGDSDFAQAIVQVMGHLRWDYEEDLSRVVGDIAAHRMAQAGRSLAHWPREAAGNVAAGAAEYLSEEIHLLVTPLDARQFGIDVDELREAVERLDQRIELLRQTANRPE
ncbi:MAG: sterol-binding protein [Burkholderiales bacterium]